MTEQAPLPSESDTASAAKPHPVRTPSRTVSRVALRRWIFSMLMAGLVVGVFMGHWAAKGVLPLDFVGRWLSGDHPSGSERAINEGEPAATPTAESVGAPDQTASGPEVSGEAYGTGLPSPASSQARAPLAAEAVAIMVQIEDFAEQIEFLPSLAQAPKLPEPPAANGDVLARIQEQVASLFRLRQIDAADQALQSLAAYEMARAQIRFRLLAARLSVQTGQPSLAVQDLQVAQGLLASEFDLSTESVQQAVQTLVEIQQSVNRLP